ncbi:MAG: hypothetical protein CME63_13065 [Halobacteriovoraceae bacterium]|nr:hypothetical protein [Halobacteriovoraceae bacterium]MBC98674.1 hypothetical protein [Halobacteriovoraceae bacterium]
MKEDTTNSLLLPSILSSKENPEKRLFIVTGKGGVGKTTLAMAFAKYLKDSDSRKVLYNSFDQPLPEGLLKELSIPYFKLCMDTSAKEYIGKKLHSETVAGWIMKTPFFSSLFNMLPGLGHMILLGHIINMLEEDPELTIVIDSPSSGHAITMFESPLNFRDMFRTGLIVNDIDRMEDFLFKNKHLQVLIAALPTLMATQEAKDLAVELEQRNVKDPLFILNDLLHLNSAVQNSQNTNEDHSQNNDELPQFIKEKCKLELEVLKELDQSWNPIAHFSETNNKNLVTAIVHYLNHGGNPS